MPNRTTVETSVLGQWINIPALEVDGKNMVVSGKFLKVASIDCEEWLPTEVEDPGHCIAALKAEKSRELRADVFTFAQKLPDTRPQYRQYRTEWDSIAAIRTDNYKAWWDSLPGQTRKNVRISGRRGVVAKIKALDDGLIRDIVELNNDSTTRQGIRYTHFGKTFEQVRKDQSSYAGRCDFVCTYLGEELIGFAKIIYCGEIAGILQFLPKTSRYEERPANALIAKCVELCGTKGMKYLTYGMFNYGNKRGGSLREFKIRNGFDEILVPHYYIPLTAKGKFMMKMNLHRHLVGILPSGVIMLGVQVRNKMRALLQLLSRCSSVPERPNRTRQTERSNPPAGSNI